MLTWIHGYSLEIWPGNAIVGTETRNVNSVDISSIDPRQI